MSPSEISQTSGLVRQAKSSQKWGFSRYVSSSRSSGLTYASNYLYVASRIHTAHNFKPFFSQSVKLSIFNPADLRQATGAVGLLSNSYLGTAVGPISVVAADDIVVVANRGHLWRIDVSNKRAPVINYEVNLHNTIQDIALHNHALFAITQEGTLVSIGVSDPTTITHQTELDLTSTLASLVFDDNYVHIAASSAGLLTVDITDPHFPQLVNTFDLDGDATDIQMDGQLGYVATSDGLTVLDLNQPTSPTIIAHCTLVPHCMASKLNVNGGHLYTINEQGISRLLMQPVIAGTVTDGAGVPLQNVAISLGSGEESTTNEHGRYVFAGIAPDVNTVTPNSLLYQFSPAQEEVNLPPSTVDVDFVALTKPVSATLTPGVSTTIVLTDVKGLSTVLRFPADAVQTEQIVHLIPAISELGDVGNFANHGFILTIMEEERLVQVTAASVFSQGADSTFARPIQVTINYRKLDLQPNIAQSTLRLLHQAPTGEWQTASNECDPDRGTALLPNIFHDMVNNRFETEICHLGTYALVGRSEKEFFPLILFQ